ncbi:MAG TPA: acetate--CoA ligase family protein [Myxococcota bacterium]|nr:acetate--CoA ligase family protein [Myxococcota bacterium]
MSINDFAARLCQSAAAEGRNTLLEPELYSLLREGGVPVPAFYTITPAEIDRDWAATVSQVPGEKVVVKVVSPEITHKTEMGGVRVVANNRDAIADACRGIMATVAERGGPELAATIRGLIVCEKVPVGTDISSQLFAGMRFSPDMGPMLAFGFGGLEAEELAVRFKDGQGMVLASPVILDAAGMMAKFKKSFVYRKLAGLTRGGQRQIPDDELLKVFDFFRMLANEFSNNPDTGWLVRDFEINPFFVSNGRLVAVDAFMRFEKTLVAERTCDIEKIQRLLKPETVAILGASSKGLNPGRIILNNLQREGFPIRNIRLVRPDCEPVDGVESVRSIAELPWRADLIVVAVAAKFVPDVIRETIEHEKAASMILIPGGMGETEGGKETDRAVRALIAESRAAGRYVPVFVGPNCLGIQSVPGLYDTMFIPKPKLPLPVVPDGMKQAESVLISQSGAYMITRMNIMDFVKSRYAISTGNQMDLGVADYVEAVLAEGRAEVFGLYIEGFSALDGLRLAKLIRKGRAQGRDFIVYKAGRTSEGRTATSSHTASISGDYPSCAETLKDAGAMVVTTLEDFNEQWKMAVTFRDRVIGGNRLSFISNAGYETVCMADSISEKPRFELAKYDDATQAAIGKILADFRLNELVSVHNPLDITPMAPDAVYTECLKAQLACSTVDACIVGIIPLSVTIKSLPPGDHGPGMFTFDEPDSLVFTLPPIVAAAGKPVMATIDCGTLYQPMAQALRARGVLVFQSVDQAMRAFQKYAAYRMGID